MDTQETLVVKPKKLKVVTINALFPELKGGAAMPQESRGEASNVRAAAANAIRNLLRQPKLKGKRYSMFTATFSVGEKEAL
jgi:hypothetical protein